MSADSTVTWEIALIVIIILLILGKRIWRSILVLSSNPNWGSSMINIIAGVACIDSSMRIHSMSATSCSPCYKSAAWSIIMLTTMVVKLRGWSCWFVVLRVSRRVLCAILIAMADHILSLIVVSWMLRGRIVIETIWSEQHLVSTLIVVISSWACVTSALSTTSHYHWWLICLRHPWSRSLGLMLNLRIRTMSFRRRASLSVFTLWAT